MGLSSHLLAPPGGRDMTTAWKSDELKRVVGAICGNSDLQLEGSICD